MTLRNFVVTFQVWKKKVIDKNYWLIQLLRQEKKVETHDISLYGRMTDPYIQNDSENFTKNMNFELN